MRPIPRNQSTTTFSSDWRATSCCELSMPRRHQPDTLQVAHNVDAPSQKTDKYLHSTHWKRPTGAKPQRAPNIATYIGRTRRKWHRALHNVALTATVQIARTSELAPKLHHISTDSRRRANFSMIENSAPWRLLGSRRLQHSRRAAVRGGRRDLEAETCSILSVSAASSRLTSESWIIMLQVAVVARTQQICAERTWR